jgi:phosphatidylserine decarboxylase
VQKGDQIGMFHYGGSTQCTLFRRGVKVSFDLHGQTPGVDSSNILVNAALAHVE